MTHSERFCDALFLLTAGYCVQVAAVGRWQPLELVFIVGLAAFWARWRGQA